MITVNGSLNFGVERDGVTHRDFVMRAATIADAIAAIETAGPESSNLRLRMFKAAAQIESLGTLDKQEITGELLLALPEDDIEPIFTAQDEVGKKQKGLSQSSSLTPN